MTVELKENCIMINVFGPFLGRGHDFVPEFLTSTAKKIQKTFCHCKVTEEVFSIEEKSEERVVTQKFGTWRTGIHYAPSQPSEGAGLEATVAIDAVKLML